MVALIFEQVKMKAVLFYVVYLITGATATCPHSDSRFKRWSMDDTWTGQAKPTEGENVFISDWILMDESPPELYNITITGTGHLVLDPSVPLQVRAANIFVQGTFEIGSEDCLYTGDVTITLTGTRASHQGEKEPKVILVEEGGTLEIHGRNKLSWTKLNGTIENPLNTGDILFDHTTNPEYNSTSQTVSGIAAYTFGLDAEDKPYVKQFGVYYVINAGDRLAEHIRSVGDGDILMMASQRRIIVRDERSQQNSVYDAVETLLYGEVTYTSVLRSVTTVGDTWAFVYQKGNPDSLAEETHPQGVTSSAAFIKGDNLVFKAEAVGDSNVFRQKDNFRISTRNGAYPLLNVIDDVTTWLPGDKIVLASTDYDYKQAEERTVMRCDDCSGTQLRLNAPTMYTHFGKVLHDAVDMRGEVALLTRNIVIQGEMQSECPTENGNCKSVSNVDTFGGHIKVLKGYGNVHMQGAELVNVGQQTDAGRYPIHFHMCLDKGDTATVPYVKDVSIHNTFARCITIHGTHGVDILDNVCYKHMGHGYFLEDGGEMYNTFDGNIAISTLQGTGTLEPVDKIRPTSFWITNPNTRVRNNVAAGGAGTGIWFIYPDEPLAPSRALKLMDQHEARSTKILEFDNNVGHSNSRAGIMIGGRLDDSRNFHSSNIWQPRVDPKDPTSDPIEVNLEHMTGYKNRFINIWMEGGLLNVSRVSVADSLNGILVTNEGLVTKFAGVLKNSVIIGDSENVGEKEEGTDRTFPDQMKRRDLPHTGVTMWKGPTTFHDLWFDGFMQNEFYDNAAIGKKRGSPYDFSVITLFSNLSFAFDDGEGLGNIVISGVKGVDAGWETNRDGELVTGFTYTVKDKKLYFVKPDHFSAAAADCIVRPSWRMAYCQTKYGNLKVQADFNELIFVRDDLPSAQLMFDMDKNTGPQVVLDGSRSYTMHFANEMPDSFVVRATGMELGDKVRVGVCLPLDAEFSLVASGAKFVGKMEKFVKVASLAELDEDSDSDGEKYYFDSLTGMVYYKFIHTKERQWYDRTECTGNICPRLKITIISGTLTDGDCRQRLYGDKLNMEKPTLPVDTDTMMANGAKDPPKNYGAGLTRPFTNRAAVDGGFSGWAEWSACSKTCDEGEQTRTRTCDSPLPVNGGANCVGDRIEKRACMVVQCAINGGLSEWSSWTNCAGSSLYCNGFSTRSRDCSSPQPQYNGVYCDGSLLETRSCSMC